MQKNDLRRGDIMLKHGLYKQAHYVIAAAQAAFSHNLQGAGSKTVHAALYYGGDRVIESSSPGLQIELLQSGVTWDVYRYDVHPDIPELATLIAENYVELQRGGEDYGKYTIKGAFHSLFHSSNLGKAAKEEAAKLWEKGHSNTFFCSNFVIRCYLAAGQTCQPVIYPIKADMNTSPKDLMARLKKDPAWQYQGRLTL